MIRRIFKIAFILFLVMLVYVFLTNIWVYSSTRQDVFTSVSEVPDAPVGVVLGTSPKTMAGTPNPYFEERIKAAAELYEMKKIRHILVSGDNATVYYNEPENMKKALIARGIPEAAITQDYAGFRTLDTMFRCKMVFDQNNVTVITQPFHTYRALFIADYLDMNAHAYATRPVKSAGIRMTIREYLARSLAVWDLYVVNKEPKFLGKKETLEL
jgi:SanA protein